MEPLSVGERAEPTDTHINNFRLSGAGPSLLRIGGWAGLVILIAAFALLNAAVAFIYLYSYSETLPVKVTVSPGQVIAVAESTELILPAEPPPLSRVGLYMTGPRLSEYAGWPTAGQWFPYDEVPALTWLLRLQTESAWGQVFIKPAGAEAFLPIDENRIWQAGSGDWYVTRSNELTSSQSGFIYIDVDEQTSYQLYLPLNRGRYSAGLVLAGPSGDDGYLLLLRPELRDMNWWRIVNGEWIGPVATVPYRAFVKSMTSQIQDVLRLFFGFYPSFLVVLALGGLVTVLAVGATRRVAPTARGEMSQPASAGRPDRTWRFAAAVVVAALVITGYIAYFILERMPHVQDSVAYLFQAKVFALGRLWAPLPDIIDFFRHEFIVEHAGKWFSKYPPGHSLLLALGVLVNAPWLVNPIAGALSLGLVYLIGRRLYDGPTGLLAAGLGLLSPFFLFMSGSMMAHPTALFFVLLGTWTMIVALDSNRLTLMALAGLSFGSAFLVRPWTAVVIAAGLGIFFLIHLRRRGLPRIAVMAVAFVAGWLPMAAAYLAYNWALTGFPLQTTQELWWEFDKLGFGPDQGPYGHYLIDGLWNTSRNMTELLRHLYGWPWPFTLMFALAPFLTLRARPADFALLAGWLALVAGYAAWWADGIMYGPRFYFESLGFLLLLTARGIRELSAIWPAIFRRLGGQRRWPQRAGPMVVCAFVGLLIAHNLALYMPQQWILYHGYNYVSRKSVNAVEQAGVTNAVVFTHVGQWFEWWNYGEVFSSNSPLLDTEVIFARDLGDVANQQLMKEYPTRKFYRLDSQGGLAPLAPSED